MKLQLLSLASLSFVYWKVVFQVRVSLSYTFSFEKGDIFRMPCKSKNVRFLEKTAHFLAIKFFSVSIVMYVGARIVWFPVNLHGKNFKKIDPKSFLRHYSSLFIPVFNKFELMEFIDLRKHPAVASSVETLPRSQSCWQSGTTRALTGNQNPGQCLDKNA